MGNTYNAAHENAVAIDTKEKISMISEIASTVIQFLRLFHLPVCCKKINKSSPRYLLLVEPFEDCDENDVSLEEKINNIENSVVDLKSTTEKLVSKIDKLEQKINSSFKGNEAQTGISKALEMHIEKKS